MKRKLYNLVTILSVVLLAGSVWWWAHSSNHLDQVTVQRDGGSTLRVMGSSGKFMLTKAENRNAEAKPSGQVHWSSLPYDANAGAPKLAWTSFSFTSQPVDGKTVESTLILPVWLLTLVFAVFPLMWVAAKFKKKPKKAGAA
jgi:hypothetical protein